MIAENKVALSMLLHIIFWEQVPKLGQLLGGREKYSAIITKTPPFNMRKPHSNLIRALYCLLNSHYMILDVAQYKANEADMWESTGTSPLKGESMSKSTVELTSQRGAYQVNRFHGLPTTPP